MAEPNKIIDYTKLSFEEIADLIDDAKDRNAINDLSVIAYRCAGAILNLQETLKLYKKMEEKIVKMINGVSKEE